MRTAYTRTEWILRRRLERVPVTLRLESGESLAGEVFIAPGEPVSRVLENEHVQIALPSGTRLITRGAIVAIASSTCALDDLEIVST